MKKHIFSYGILCLVLIGCATATPYKAAEREKDDGYRDQKIETAKYRVSFRGNESTSKETAELYVLYRSAELALKNGYDYFVMEEPDKEADLRFNSPGTSIYGGTGWGGRGRFGGVGIGFGTSSADKKYDVSSYITLHKGTVPKDNPKAYVAADVKDNLESRIIRKK